ncbi:hypothetical protein DCAR_0934133 [Daucus carota subsp. sativus]|uniref:Uncharacterized protein n=1 Tax=Daucus carota subsp. sativus TaxID=79200 RepID=A0AAF0XUN3_DAUCS|nr:PREDICTED: uncharacterized protein LOC108202869 [Daucus carota subsp. sativus]WOH14613.1 hypothetical protein DCAR_0934133 [Daucus carota subsp. sativus]
MVTTRSMSGTNNKTKEFTMVTTRSMSGTNNKTKATRAKSGANDKTKVAGTNNKTKATKAKSGANDEIKAARAKKYGHKPWLEDSAKFAECDVDVTEKGILMKYARSLFMLKDFQVRYYKEHPPRPFVVPVEVLIAGNREWVKLSDKDKRPWIQLVKNKWAKGETLV